MSTWDGGFSPAQNFHLEFGYLCPSAQFRRTLRNAVVALVAGTVIAASVAFALLPQLAPQPAGDGGREQTALSLIAVPPADKAADIKAASVADAGMPAATIPAAAMARAVATERAAAAHAWASCEDLSGSFLAPQCQLGKTGKSHATHTARPAHDAGNRVATVSIGRPDGAPEARPQGAASRAAAPQEQGPGRAAAARPAPAVETGNAATNEAPTGVMPPSRPDKKPVKTAHKQAPNPQPPGRDAASAESPAAAPSHGFDLFALFHQPPRTGTWALQ